jgi:outer membrane protein assembly factor BamE (lipoprotein component of BamABCDE complex)
MKLRVLVVCAIIGLVVACKVETYGPGEIHRIISEQEFAAIPIGTSRADVEKTIGKPVAVVPGAEEEWRYTVLRGNALTLPSFLFRENRKVELAEGVVFFSAGKVVRVRVQPTTKQPTPSQPR